jgi:hypothetical protein
MDETDSPAKVESSSDPTETKQNDPKSQKKGILAMVGTPKPVPAAWTDEHTQVYKEGLINGFKIADERSKKVNTKTLRVSSRSYNARNATLWLESVPIQIQKHEKNRGEIRGESKEARLLRLLFDPVKDIRSGVKYSRVLSITEARMTPEKTKLVKNYMAEVNKKILEAGGPGDLIIRSQIRVYINNIYL